MKHINILILALFVSYQGYAQEYFNHTVSFSYFPWVFDGGMNAVETDGGYVINGATGDPVIHGWHRIGMLKLSETGEVLIRKNWGDTTSRWYNNSRSSLIIKDNNYYSIGSKVSYYDDSSHSELMMIKYDNNLDTVWSQYYGKKTYPYDTSYIGRSFIEIEDGFMIVGSAYYPNYAQFVSAFFIKSDTAGGIIWEKRYDEQNFYFPGYSVVQTTDNGYAIGGYRFVFGHHGVTIGDPIIIKTDSLGNEQWRYNMGSQYQDGIPTLCQTEEGNILAVARYDFDSIYDDKYLSRIRYLELDNDGEILQDKFFGDKVLWMRVDNCRPVAGNGFIVCGKLWSHPATSGFMLRIDGEADSLWYRQYALDRENSGTNYLRDAIPTSDGGFLGVGTSNYDGEQKVWVVKVDSMGCESEWDCWVGEKEWREFEEKGDMLKIYPNPARGRFTVRSQQSAVGSQKIQVFDLFGRKVEEIKMPKGQTEIEVNTTGWSKGVYIVRVTGECGLVGNGKVLVE